ncbi:DUF1311 domain-containing protein [Mesobaculum littorinae]|uniref:DUF1311 domain-containing protein n=1 Tax=Mesobaculum littorinae TaxID=2486419 RepID=A0A438AMW3_9RHOB|nr:lysozyme inhibitor LprI family protein [Mesobaculum littorinae]RVV99886.1 DUF1311 domain-containing protein [Mesobaculum littorinae]
MIDLPKAAFLIAAALAGPTVAQSADDKAAGLDCANAMTTRDMAECAKQDWQSADDALNAAYREAVERARQIDGANEPDGAASTEAALRAAQRDWVSFRDSACEAETRVYGAGTMAPIVGFSCRERLTRQRTEDLTEFGASL